MTPPRPLRILHYVPAIRLEQGGVVRAILDWCSVLARRGHKMTLVVYDGKDLPGEWLRGGGGLPRAVLLPSPNPPLKQLDRRSMRLVTALLAEADVLHLHAPWLDGNRQLANLAAEKKVPYVLTLHGMLDDWAMQQGGVKKRLYMTLFGRRTLDRAAVVHCTAGGELAQAGKWFGRRSTVILPYLMDLSAYENLPEPGRSVDHSPEPNTTPPRLLFLSRLGEQKGVDLLIQTAGLLRDGGHPFLLLIAGTGAAEYEAMLRRLVAALNLENRVRFLGQVNGAEKLALYQSADLFVLPTRHENFGLVLTEAMACGTPVLTTRGTDIWPEVEAAGGTVAESTPAALAAAVVKLLADPTDLRRRGRRGRDWVFEHLSVSVLAAEYEALYRAASGPAPGTPV